MRWFGAFFRWILSINAIWGLMIVTAFLLTVWQHFTPKPSGIDNALWKDGPNTVAIKLLDKDSKVRSTEEFTLTRQAGQLVIPAEYQKQTPGKSYLVSARDAGKQTILKWDSLDPVGQPASGNFIIEVNGKFASKSSLVTLQSLTDAALDYAKIAFNVGLGLVSTMVLFLGLMKVGEEAGIVALAAKIFRPVIRLLFPDIPKDHPANGAILMNITTSVLGLANAATPFALKAMMELQNLNKHKKVASNSMVMFLGWNTAGLALLPATLIAVRKSAGCANPYEIIGPCIVAGLTATIVAVIATKVLALLPFFSVESALAEIEAEDGPEATEADKPAEEASDDNSKEKVNA